MVECVNVPRRTESRHLPNRFCCENRLLPELFTGMNVRKMNLDERHPGIEQGIKNRVAKLLIGVGKGKRQVDRRNTIKERDAKREIDRAMRSKI